MPESRLSELMTVQQAVRLIDAEPVAPREVSVGLEDSVGLRLAADLVADRDFPPFRKSIMDGYAVRCADLTGGSAVLKVVATIAAGQSPRHPLGPGEAMAIMTGAPMPDGADGVAPVEDVESRVAIGENVRVIRANSPERFVAAAGSDCPAGRVVLKAGTLIGAPQIAVLASIGAASVRCFARPRVAVIGAGDELVDVGQAPAEGQIRDSNTPMLASLLRRLGAEVASVERVPDVPEMIADAIARASAFDAMFLAGGISMGEFDFVPRLLAEAGVVFHITKLRIKPGKPFVFGVIPPEAPHERESDATQGGDRANARFVFGLPGNPVSAFVCTVRFASRLLDRMAGGRAETAWAIGRLDAGLSANGSREFYLPAVLHPCSAERSAQAEFPLVTPLNWKGSADVFTLAGANCLIVRGEDEPPTPKGAVVSVLRF